MVFEITDFKKAGFGKTKFGLIICVVLVVALVFSNVWFFRENEALIIERDGLKTEVDTLKTEMASLITERDDLKDEVDILVAERDEARAEVETLMGVNKTLTAGVEALIKERDSLKIEVAERQHEIFLRDREIDSLKGQISSLNYQIDELNDQIEELEGSKLEEDIAVKGLGWIEENEEWLWRERVYGRIVNVGLGDAHHVTLIVRWYLGEELVGIKEYYRYVLGGVGGVWEIDEYFTFDEQPDTYEVELSWE